MTGTKRKASDLSTWLWIVLHLYGARVLPFDSPTAEIAGALADLARGRSHSPGFADIAIAATARRHEPYNPLAQRAPFRSDGRSRRRPVPETSRRQIRSAALGGFTGRRREIGRAALGVHCKPSAAKERSRHGNAVAGSAQCTSMRRLRAGFG